MARPDRRIWMIVFKNFLNSFKPRLSNSVLVGEDKLGNKYYEAAQTSASNRRRASRYYLPLSGEEDFDQRLPAEWEAWIRGRRKLPPTPEEIAKNDAIAALKKENALKIDAEMRDSKLPDISKETTGPAAFPKYGDEYEPVPGHNKPAKS